MNLYADIQALRNTMDALFLEFPELADDEQFRADVMEGETAINDVLARLVNVSRDAETMAEAVKARKLEIGERQSRFERKAEAARKLILSVMEKAELPKIQLTEATLSMRHLPPAPIVQDVDALPDNCVRIERKPDMKAIKAELEGGREVPGIAMSNGRPSLTIRTK